MQKVTVSLVPDTFGFFLFCFFEKFLVTGVTVDGNFILFDRLPDGAARLVNVRTIGDPAMLLEFQKFHEGKLQVRRT